MNRRRNHSPIANIIRNPAVRVAAGVSAVALVTSGLVYEFGFNVGNTRLQKEVATQFDNAMNDWSAQPQLAHPERFKTELLSPAGGSEDGIYSEINRVAKVEFVKPGSQTWFGVPAQDEARLGGTIVILNGLNKGKTFEAARASYNAGFNDAAIASDVEPKLYRKSEKEFVRSAKLFKKILDNAFARGGVFKIPVGLAKKSEQ